MFSIITVSKAGHYRLFSIISPGSITYTHFKELIVGHTEATGTSVYYCKLISCSIDFVDTGLVTINN